MTEDNASNPAEGVAPETDEPIEGSQPEGSEPEEGSEVPEQQDADGEASSDGDGEDEDTQGEPEAEELNFGGEKLTIPKGAIPEEVKTKLQDFAKNLEAGYTRKFQDVAEQRKQAEARLETVERLATLEGDALQTFSRGLQIKSEIERLGKIDLNALWQSNPDQARRVSDEMNRLNGEFQKVTQETSRKEAEAAEARRKFTDERMAEGRQIVERQIKGFNESEVIDYVTKTHGMSAEEAKTWPLNPVTAIMAHKAMLYDRMQASAKPKPAQKQAAPAKPSAPVKGKGGAGVKNPSNMSPAEMAKHLGLPG